MNDQGFAGAEDADAVDIRLMLQGVLSVREPEQRDLAGPAVSVVLRGRKRMRILTYAASAVVLVVLGGAVALGALAGGGGGGSAGPAATTATPTPTGSDLSAGERGWAKQQDILDRLPDSLNAVLPAGYRLSVAKDDQSDGTGFVLTGPTGTNDVHVSAAPASDGTPMLQGVGGGPCAAGARCSSRVVSGGTLYLQLKDFPANYGGACCFQKGHETDVLGFDDQYAFVPTSGTGYSYVLTMTARQAYPRYGDRPRDWPTDSAWPPDYDHVPGNVETTFNAGGALLSTNQFLAMVTNPAMAAVGKLLDPGVAPSETAVKEFEQADASIQAATKDLLPPGFKLSLDAGPGSTELLLTGPSGVNTIEWQVAQQLPTWEHGWACETHTEKECEATDVPGGELSVTTPPKPTQVDAQGQHAQRLEEKYYAFLPDDRNGTVVRMTLLARSPSGGVLLTPEQFLALAKNPGIAAAVATVNGFLHQPS